MIHALLARMAIAFRLRRSLAFIIVLGMGALGPVRPAAAHGAEGTLQLDQVRLGPYRLSAWTYPGYLSVGKIALSVAVLEAQSNASVQNGKVLVQLTPLEADGGLLNHHPSSYPTIQHPLYDFEVELATPGPYRVIVQVQDASGWAGETSFSMVVHPEVVWLKWLIIVLLIQAGLVGAWLVQDAVKVWGGRRWAVLGKT
jgi:hypothetical protein